MKKINTSAMQLSIIHLVWLCDHEAGYFRENPNSYSDLTREDDMIQPIGKSTCSIKLQDSLIPFHHESRNMSLMLP